MRTRPRDLTSPRVRRLVAFSCYFGVVPLLELFRVRRKDTFLYHHKAKALAVWLMLLPILLLSLAGLLIVTYLIVNEPYLFDLDLSEAVLHFLPRLFLFALAVWGCLWLATAGTALAGSTWRPPLLRGDRSVWARRLAMGWSWFLLLAVPFLTAFTGYASGLARTEGGPAPVYFLFEHHGYEAFGLWGPKALFYRVSREATARWGKGSVVVAAIGRDTLVQALRHGRFVVLLCHGDEGRIVTADLMVALPRGNPSGRVLDLISRQTGEVERVEVGSHLKFLYNSGCRVGVRGYAWRWQQRLFPAEVVTFGRLSGGLEHFWWIWEHAPERLRAIP